MPKTGVHNEKQLANFMALQQSVRDPLDSLQWRVFLFEDYSPAESLFVFKVHHAIADDTALIQLLFSFQDDPLLKNMPKVTSRITWLQQIVMMLILPLNIVWCSFLTVVCLPKENNGFKTPEI